MHVLNPRRGSDEGLGLSLARLHISRRRRQAVQARIRLGILVSKFGGTNMQPTGNRLNVFRKIRLTTVTYPLDPSAMPRDWLAATLVVLTETVFTAALVCWIKFLR